MRDDEDSASLEAVGIECPNCGRPVELLVDCSVGRQDYIEDCEVCCHPIRVDVSVGADGVPIVQARHEDE